MNRPLVFCAVAVVAVGATYACLVSLSPAEVELIGRLGVCTRPMRAAEPEGCVRLSDRPRLLLTHIDSNGTPSSRRVIAVGVDRTFSVNVAQGHYALAIDDNGTLRQIANPANQYTVLIATRGLLVSLGTLVPDPGWHEEGTVADT